MTPLPPQMIALIGLAFTFVLAGGAIWSALRARGGEVVATGPAPVLSAPDDRNPEWSARLIEAIGKLARPEAPGALQSLQCQLDQAGWRARGDLAWYLAGRSLLAIGLPGLALLLLPPLELRTLLGVVLVTAAVGYYAPWIALRVARSSRQDTILRAFPNALDMLVSCLEAGLGLDAAIQRVSRELPATSPELAEDLDLVVVELAAGVPREEALRHLDERTGLREVNSLVNVIAHADRYGAGVADSIRAHADLTRRRRAMDAERRAAEAAPKLTIVMVVFILPALFVVVLGPTVVHIVERLIPTLVGIAP